MSEALFHIEDAHNYVGKEIALTDWLTINQQQVDEFASATLDPDWMHIDVERSKREGPYGTTIVQGFLTMSLVIHLSHENNLIPGGTAYGLNYGMDHVRFTDVVTVGSRVRSRIKLLSVEPRDQGRYLYKTEHILEVEGSDKPGMVAEWLVMWFTELSHDR